MLQNSSGLTTQLWYKHKVESLVPCYSSSANVGLYWLLTRLKGNFMVVVVVIIIVISSFIICKIDKKVNNYYISLQDFLCYCCASVFGW